MSTNPAALQESRIQSSVTFPCSMYRADARVELPGRPLITKNHWHRSLEIIHCEKGLFQIGVNMELYEVTEEAFFFIRSEVLSEKGSLTQTTGIEDARSHALKEVLSYIDGHRRDKIYIHDLARIMNMNEQYFCRFFKKTVGRTPITYVNEIRIRDTALRIASTNDPISTIAEDNGFVNMGNFIKQFKKVIGVGPAEYRKAMRGGI